VPGLVTFEVLARSFRLNRPGLADLGLLVHCLDVGGAEPPETAGVETVLEGLRDSISYDDELLAAASVIFDGLYAAHRTST